MEKAEERGEQGDDALAADQAREARRAGGPVAAERDGIEDPGEPPAGENDAGGEGDDEEG